MKTISFKSFLQSLVLCAVLITSIIVSRGIYQDIKQVCNSQPANAATNCFFEVISR